MEFFKTLIVQVVAAKKVTLLVFLDFSMVCSAAFFVTRVLGSAGSRLSVVLSVPDKVQAILNFNSSFPFSVSAYCNVYTTSTCLKSFASFARCDVYMQSLLMMFLVHYEPHPVCAKVVALTRSCSAYIVYTSPQ